LRLRISQIGGPVAERQYGIHDDENDHEVVTVCPSKVETSVAKYFPHGQNVQGTRYISAR
jgi:hypothetical protein